MVGGHELLTAKEVSDILHIHLSTLHKMIRAAGIPSFRVGSDWRFRKDLLMRWMAEQR